MVRILYAECLILWRHLTTLVVIYVVRHYANIKADAQSEISTDLENVWENCKKLCCIWCHLTLTLNDFGLLHPFRGEWKENIVSWTECLCVIIYMYYNRRLRCTSSAEPGQDVLVIVVQFVHKKLQESKRENLHWTEKLYIGSWYMEMKILGVTNCCVFIL